MRFEVPQFIDIEDKIFGPLTWKQFLYLSGGIGMCVALFLVSKVFFIILGIPLAILSGALAFYPVNNRPFSFFLESLLSYLKKQKLYIWKHDESSVYKHSKNEVGGPQSFKTGHTRAKKNNIASLSRELELQAIQKKES